jgi:hypothetical protein
LVKRLSPVRARVPGRPGSPSAVLSCILRDGQGWWIGEPRTRYAGDGTSGRCLYRQNNTWCKTW